MSTISFQERQHKIDQLEQKINVLSSDKSELLFEKIKQIELKVIEQEKFFSQFENFNQKLLKFEECINRQQITLDERNDKLDDLVDKVEDRNDKISDLLEKIDNRNDKIDELLENVLEKV